MTTFDEATKQKAKFLIGSGQELYRGMKSVLLKTEIG